MAKRQGCRHVGFLADKAFPTVIIILISMFGRLRHIKLLFMLTKLLWVRFLDTIIIWRNLCVPAKRGAFDVYQLIEAQLMLTSMVRCI